MPELTTPALLSLAADGDQAAWDELVERHARLVWAVLRSYRLDDATAADVFQTVWLRLVEQVDRIRDPERLAAWLATTARREALRVLRRGQREAPTESVPDHAEPFATAPGDDLVAAEEHAAVLAAFARLPESCQTLLRLLTADPPLDYRTIAELVDRPIGSIGPTRQRCLDRLRALLLEGDPDDTWEGR
jgi:RNA polymerase sigma factor (sigma-70 family)